MRKLPRVLLIALVLVLHAWSRRASPRESPRFVLAKPVVAEASRDIAPRFLEELIDPHPATRLSHVPSICELPDGRLAAAWYGGSKEGAPDVSIFLAFRQRGPDGGWTTPRVVVDRASASRELGRYVRKVSNAVLFTDANGKLWLVYDSTAIPGAVGSSLNFKTSADGGETWTSSRRLTLGPFFNMGEMVKNKPALLSGGGLAVPMYHEFINDFPEILWLDGTNLPATKTRVFGGRVGYQPSLAPMTPETGVLLCRAPGAVDAIQVSRTADGGRSWSAPVSAGLPNPDSGLDVIRLSDGRLLLAFNDSAHTRFELKLAISADDGATWQRKATLARDASLYGVSYPFLLQTRDGDIHVVYTVNKQAIWHAVFNAAWLASPSTPANESR